MQITQSRASYPVNGRGARSRLLMVFAALSALVLTACGADVNSRLDLESDYSGQRLFVLTMADSDVDMLSGGVEAAEQALQIHTPGVLTFEGIETQDDGYSATFAMPFDDVDDYHDNVTALLEASNVPANARDMNVEIDDQTLTTSVTFEESFYNDDLMGWAAEALINEEVVAASTTVFTSSGSATVMFEGQEVETSTTLPRINFSMTQDHRFPEVGLDVEVFESGDIYLALSYRMSDSGQQAQSTFLTDQVQQLNELDDVDGDVSDSGPVDLDDAGSAVREVEATFTSAEAVTEAMQLLLANDDATFDVIEQTTQGSPDTSIQYVGMNWVCDAICDPNNLQQLSGETRYPEHWDVTEQRRENGELFLAFNRGMPLHSLTSSTQLHLTGKMVQDFEFVVDNQTLEGHEEAVADRFAPPEGLGSYETTVHDATTIYRLNFEATDAAALVSVLNEYLEAKEVDETIMLRHDPLTGLWASYDFEADLSAVWELATGGVEGAASFEVVLPAMHSGESTPEGTSGRTLVIDEADGNLSITASGPTVTTVWVAALTLLLVAVFVTLLFRTRRAASRVWSAAQPRTDGPPYNVQGPRDRLTETQILASPAAPGPHASETSKLSGEPVTDHTRSYEHTEPFPDVVTPSPIDYEQLREKLEKPADSTRTDPVSESSHDDDADPPTRT